MSLMLFWSLFGFFLLLSAEKEKETWIEIKSEIGKKQIRKER